MPALIELGDAKVMLGIPAEDTTQDDKLTRLISAASELIEVYLRRKLRFAEHTETAWQKGECLWLRGYPVQQVIEIMTGDRVLDVPIVVDKVAGLVRRKDGLPWPHLPEGYTVRYLGGLDSVPMTIQNACLMLTQQMDGATANGGGVVQSERIGDYSITYASGSATGAADGGGGLDAFSPAILALLRPYMGRRV